MFEIVTILLTATAKMGYWGIILLMAIESSFIPFPSEVVIPPAAYLASMGQMNVYLVIASGVAGSLIGAFFNYYLAMTLGRKLVFVLAGHRFAKYFLIDQAKIEKAEKYFVDHGSVSTFVGRLVPAIRQLISIPAGFVRMDLKKFFLFTTLGSGSWTVILAILGYQFGANQELLSQYYKEISWFFVAVFVLLIGYYAFVKTNGKKVN
ncbi:DedA family protein [Candidatus Parcubacteria bacterium]|nr:DedA family protein [Patescibacteria group bacterium]MBU4309234.1 DedA family protein [Patescibacteria group bacterium]MBU4432322.1 DedA family protein [Patescibacteria group bacterium]MBU4577595.1 DedA family protein [Patescibacteria group bacterium]MCG2697282.1 DedA family protein [Candidatus Parcubacteria bacterium]